MVPLIIRVIPVARPPSAGSPFDPTTPLSRDATTPLGSDERYRFDPGTVLAGRYRIVEVAGEGGMGVVYAADDLELSERVALKTLHAGAAAEEREVARLRREVQLARRVTHPNVCRIYDAGRHEDIVFVTMELLEGETLTSYLAAKGRLQPAEAAAILRQLCAGLQAAHDAGVIHRDLKSGNVMLVRRGSDMRAVITDFGLARTSAPTMDALASHGRIIGTPAYMAPEQIEGADVTLAADIYALGVVAFEMITGELPFLDSSIGGLLRRLREPAPTPRTQVPDVDPRWEAVIVRCLARDPKERFASAADVARALDGQPVQRRPRRWSPIAAAVALALLVIVPLFLIMRRSEPAPGPATVAAKPARRAVAILGFRNLSGRPEAEWLSTALAEMLATELAAAESLRIISGEEIARAKRDLELATVESHSAATLAKIRAATGADAVILGSYVALPDTNLRLDVRVQSTGGGEAASFGATGTEADLFTLVARAGGELRSRLGAEARLAEGLDLRRAVPVNSEAARHFAVGVAKLREFDAVAARDALERAIAADPQFALAYGELSDALAILGYDERAAQAARRGVELSAGLPLGERLLLDAKHHHRAHRLERAINLYRSLVTQFPDDPEHRVRLITALVENSRGTDALAEVAAMRKLHGAYDADPRVELLDSWSTEVTSDFQRMLASADRAIAKARAAGNRDVAAEALIMRANALAQTGKTPEALAAFDEAEELFAASGNRAGVAKSLRKRSFISWRRGDLDEARRLNERALRIYRDVGQQLGAASSIGGIGVILNTQGDRSGARARFIEAREIYQRIGDRQNVAWALSSIAGTYVMQNALAEGVRRYEEALVISRELGDISQIANALANLGITHAMNGDLARAEPSLLEALALFRKAGNRSAEAECELVLGDLLFKKGDLRAARRYYDGAMKVRRELGERGAVADTQLSLASLHVQEGNPTSALALASAAASEYEAEERTDSRARALIAVIRANVDLGRTDDARAALKTARGLLSAVEDPEVAVYLDFEEARHAQNIAALEQLVKRTEREKMVDANFDVRLELAKAELRAGRRASAVARAEALAKDAAARGYGLVVQEARAIR